ncbi:MAG TPA: Spy/CpxP family protein refolding chaperone [Vicinamibacterales bacterium]|jgi:Spy/CpxP family protein refolding chaperone
MRGLIGTVMAVAMVVSIAAMVTAQQQGAQGTLMHRQGAGMRHGGPGPMGSGPFAALNLTEEQKTQIHQIMADQQAQHQRQPDAMGDLHKKLQAAIFGDSPDVTAAKAIAAQIQQLQAQMMDSHIDTMAKVAGVLTSDQKKIAREQGIGFGPMGMGPGGPGRRGMMQHQAPKK